MNQSIFSNLKVRQKEMLANFLIRGRGLDTITTIPALEGFLYGIAITPDISIYEWMISEIMYDRMIENHDEIDFIMEILLDAYTKLLEKFRLKRLKFPFKVTPEKLTSKFEWELQQWCLGFYYALKLRPHIWKLEYIDENIDDENMDEDAKPPEELIPHVLNLQIIYNLAFAEEIPEMYGEFMQNPDHDKAILAYSYFKIEEAVNSLIAYATKIQN